MVKRALFLTFALFLAATARGQTLIKRHHICASGSPPAGGILTTPDSEHGRIIVHATKNPGAPNGNYTVFLNEVAAITFTISGGAITTNDISVLEFDPFNQVNFTVATRTLSTLQGDAHAGGVGKVQGSGTASLTNGDQNNSGGFFTCCSNGCSGANKNVIGGTLNVTLGPPPITASWTGSIKANCSTQHALGLTINGVQVSYQVTSIFATKAAPSTVSISYSCDSTSIDCADGKPWILSVDGAATQSGNISYAGGNVSYVLNVAGKGAIGNPVFFDCAPPSGVLNLNGTLTIPPSGSGHTLSVKVNGVTVGSTSSAGGASTQTTLSLNKVQDNVNNGDTVEWYVDGVLVKTDTVAMNCSYNAEMQQTYCSGTSTYSGTATQNASPTPTATARPTPSPTAPPQNPQYTPPPPPTYTPPPPQSTPTGGGDVRIMNPESIYQPIVDALKVDNSGTASRNNSAAGTGADFSARGHLDDLQPQLESAVNKVDQIKTKGVASITSLKDSFSTLPTSLGTVTTVNFGTGLFNGVGPTAARFTTLPTNVDLTPYMTGINLARTVMLWALTIFFGFLTVRAFTWTQ